MKKHQKPQSDAEYVKGGKGRRDEVGRSGVYPASAPDAPAGAELRGQEELGHRPPHGEALQRIDDGHEDEGVPEFDEPKSALNEPQPRGGSSSEHDRSVRDSEIRRETQTSAAMGRLPGTNINPDGTSE
jgi:hypothetical protein